ncbi:carboxypeptidase M32 [Cetobacterium sp. SF1]|uniref:carboxypeptidase M32 n=1 Tax=Cetobacterium sp. SF1 TaxID=3417654 RepID=UPI003CF49A07
MESRLERFRELIKEKKLLDSTLAILHWDLETEAPKAGQELLSQMIGNISLKSYEISTSPELIEIVEFLREMKNELTPVEKKEIEDFYEEMDKLRKIPAEDYKAYTELTAKAQGIWAEAKDKNDYKIFENYLEQIFDYNRIFANYREPEKDPYDVILNDYEKGMNVEKLDEFFRELRREIVPLLEKIKMKKINNEDYIEGKVKKCNQIVFSKYLGEYLGFDFNRGIISQSEHPFTLTVNRDDVRITTKYIEELPLSSIFSTIHECGHGIYEQGIGEELKDTLLADGASMGIHESQSRFYENVLGRSMEFWQPIYKNLQEKYEYLKNVTLDEFYKGINSVRPSLIRVEADELTYSLHIMIRYEIEKGILNGKYKISQLPEIWNEKMKEYLGVEPKNDSEGVLQDVHWSCGLIGYFPSYALGNVYSIQIYNKMKEEMNIKKLLEDKKLDKIKEWLRNNIHKYGKMKTPKELIEDITGEGLNAKGYIEYLKEKYSKIYNLN